MNKPHLLVHHSGDSVGVIVIEGLEKNTTMHCAVLDSGATFSLTCNQSAPIGHKIALVDLAVGDTVIKYGADIGKVVAPIKKGDHVHVHNLKTKRW
ncbi:MAG: UxaA family hydrolase [Methylacidiphilales bacterium]|nr:UxaA family hydrolase [Candidatus Methylacidiphilales bacterium]